MFAFEVPRGSRLDRLDGFIDGAFDPFGSLEHSGPRHVVVREHSHDGLDPVAVSSGGGDSGHLPRTEAGWRRWMKDDPVAASRAFYEAASAGTLQPPSLTDDDDFQRFVQSELQSHARQTQFLSNLMTALHEIMKAAIQNLRV